METLLTKFSPHFHEALLGFLWRQWSALGGSGSVHSSDEWLIDPEALLLFSTRIARRDARLFDEVLDWLQLNADRINLQRLGRLQKEHALGEATVLAAIAAQLTKAKAHPKWRSVAARALFPSPNVEPRPLFAHLPVIGRCDDAWLTWGWQRPAVELRGLSQRPKPDQPSTFIFKLRALFGLQTRAEVMAWLLTHETGHPAEIARATGYFRGSIQSVLNELTQSGHLGALRVGREKRFGLRHSEWHYLMTWTDPKEFPQWIPWVGVFGLLQRVNDVLEHPGLFAMSVAVQSIELDRAVAPAAELLPTRLWPSVSAGLTGEAALVANLERLRGLINYLQSSEANPQKQMQAEQVRLPTKAGKNEPTKWLFKDALSGLSLPR